MDHTERVPLLKLGRVLQEEQPRVHLQDLLEQLLEIAHCGILLPCFRAQQPKGAHMRAFILEFLPHLVELLSCRLHCCDVARASLEQEGSEVTWQPEYIRYEAFRNLKSYLPLGAEGSIDGAAGSLLGCSVNGLAVGEEELGYFAGGG